MTDFLMAVLEGLGFPTVGYAVLLVGVLVVLIVRWLRHHKVILEHDESNGAYEVDLLENRIYRTVLYKVRYPKILPFLGLLLYDMKVEYPRHVQVDEIAYFHPDHDPLDEPTPFSRLGELKVSIKWEHPEAEPFEQAIQTIPKKAAKDALGTHEAIFRFLPFYRKLKGVRQVVLEVSYPLAHEKLNLVTLDDEIDRRASALRLVVTKNEKIDKVRQYQLSYELPDFISSLKLHRCPPEAHMPMRPEDILVVSTTYVDEFNSGQSGHKHTLNWTFDVSLPTTEIEFHFSESHPDPV